MSCVGIFFSLAQWLSWRTVVKRILSHFLCTKGELLGYESLLPSIWSLKNSQMLFWFLFILNKSLDLTQKYLIVVTCTEYLDLTIKGFFFSISERLGFQNEIWFKAMSKSIVTQSNWPSRKNSLSLISKSINYLHVWDVMLKSQSSEKCKELPVNISQCLLKSVNPNLTWNFYDFIISYRWIVSYCLNKLHYDYPFHCWRMLRLFPFPNCCE